MSKLLECGVSAPNVAKIEVLVKLVQKINLRSLDSCATAIDAATKLANIIVNDTGSSMTGVISIMKTCYDIPYMRCDYSGNIYPSCVMVTTPDGQQCRADYLHTGHAGNWEYADNGTIVHSGKLYGDKDILNYSTDPLQYLKFRCMPDERIQYNLKEDSSCDEEYNGNAPVFLGVELEVERKSDTPKRIERMVASDLGMDYMILKSDGSLQNGFEIVTAPSTLRFHLQAWEKFFDKDTGSAKYLSSYASGRCGMHVHVSRKALTPMHLGKIITFMNNHENRDFITTLAARNSSFSKFVEDRHFHVKTKLVSTLSDLTGQLRKLTKPEEIKVVEAQIAQIRTKIAKGKDCLRLLSDIEHGGDRYNSVNLTKRGTIEFRIFRGNVSKIGMLKNLEFVDAVVNFTRECTFRTRVLNTVEIEERKLKRKENTDYALHYTYFLDWLSKDTTGNYNNLKLWLQTHKVSDKFSRRKVSKYAPTKCRDRTTEAEVRACA